MKTTLVVLLIAMMSTSYAASLPPDSAYVTVNADGHLSINGKRERFWAVIGKPYIASGIKANDDSATRSAKLEQSRKGTDFLLDRFTEYGFNAIRLWDVTTNETYTVGDGSSADCIDYFVAQAKKRGFRIWSAGMGNRVGRYHRDEVTSIDDPETAAAWQAAVDEYNTPKHKHKGKRKPIDIRHSMARYWDPRLEAIYIKRMRANAQHLNKHTVWIV